MTETEFRQKVVDTASSWIGTQEGTSRHAEMLKRKSMLTEHGNDSFHFRILGGKE